MRSEKTRERRLATAQHDPRSATKKRRVASRNGEDRHEGGICIATERVMPFQVPSNGSCTSAGAGPPRRGGSGHRYFFNHGHQAEILVPMIDKAVLRFHVMPPPTTHRTIEHSGRCHSNSELPSAIHLLRPCHLRAVP